MRPNDPRGISGLTAGILLTLIVSAPALAQSRTSVFHATLQEANQRTAEVSTEELRRILADKSALVLDARPHMEYAMSHIPGALNVAPKPGVLMSMYVSDVAEIQRLVGGDKTKRLVLYCNGPFAEKASGSVLNCSPPASPM